MRSAVRFLADLLIPGAVLVAAAVAVEREDVVFAAVVPFVVYFCYGALAAAVLLCWYYDQSRLLCSAAAAALIALALERWPEAGHAARESALLLFPANVVLFALVNERGAMTTSGLLRMALVAAQALAVSWLGAGALTWPGPGWLMPVSFGLGTLVLAALVLRRRTKVEQGLLWAFVAVGVGLIRPEPDRFALFAGAAGLVLVMAVLEHGFDIAFRDELTGLPSRRAFAGATSQLGSRYAIAMCDVDHFKQVNDTYGHETGNQVLRMVAEKLSDVGGGGRAFRYGGEEFLVVFRGRSAREAEPFVDGVRQAIETAELTPSRSADPEAPAGSPVRVSISVGIADRSTRHSTPSLVLEAADAALYEAKDAGRNCVRLADAMPQAG